MDGTSEETKQEEGPGAVANAPESTHHTIPDEEDLMTRTLKFLSTASSETIFGITVALAACTYMILGRVGLILIGALGGVMLHATWEGKISAAVEDGRREKSLDVVSRILDLRAVQQRINEDNENNEMVGNSFEGFQPETAAALNELVDAVIRDYVKRWYHPLLPAEASFPAASRQTLTKFILAISQHLSRKRHADTFLDFLTNSSSIVIVFLNELSTALSVSQGNNVTPAEAIQIYLSTNPESNLANVLNEKQQSRKFKIVAEDILQNFLEKSTYGCDPARAFLREILAGLILQMSLETFSNPEFINGCIVYLLEDGEPDLSQAIDVGMGGSKVNDSLGASSYDIDGNLGNIGLAKPSRHQSEQQTQENKGHQKRLSKAEEAMEEAMEEAKRLSQLIAEEDAKRLFVEQGPLDDVSEALVAAVQHNAHCQHVDTSGLMRKEASALAKTAEPIPNGAATPTALQSASDKQKLSTDATTPEPPDAAYRESQDLAPPPQSSASLTSAPAPAFTSFDQIIPQSTPVALQEEPPVHRSKSYSLTLHNANIIIDDDSMVSDKGRLRSKPSTDYLVQIEPASSDFPGWMIVRRYPDFESLHEVLRRIAQIAGVKAFVEQHHTLPNWKEHTKPSLRGELERYLRDALWYKELAESEGMKRFLDKDRGQSASTTTKNGFPGLGWSTPSAFENMGKGMLDVLTSAPKGVAEGGKAIGGGISGVFTNIGSLGQKKSATGSSINLVQHTAARSSTSALSRMDSMNSIIAPKTSRMSEDSSRPTSIVQMQPSPMPSMERQPSDNFFAEGDNEREPHVSASARSSMSSRSVTYNRDLSRAPSRLGTPLSSPTQGILGEMKLPPLPDDIPDDYGSSIDASSFSNLRTEGSAATARTSTSTAPSQQSSGCPPLSATNRSSIQSAAPIRKQSREQTPITEAETRVAVELLFAVVSEVYTLTSVWNIRRTLLNGAKAFLLRPSNPSLAAIQSLIQESIIASNTSDAGLSSHLRKLRKNTLPTEDELRLWPAAMSAEEKEKLRIKARKLLVERGMPAALTGVMGQAASGEAVGKIFDCLQVEEVAKGLVYGLLLQGVRAVTQ